MIDLKALIPGEHIVMGLGAVDRRELLRQLSAPLAARNLISDHELFLDDLERREDQITTQIESGLAFPHARSNAAKRLSMVVGLTGEEGVVFNPAVGEPCRIFFLIAIPACAPTAHLPLLQRLAAFAHSPERRQKLMTAESPAKVVRYLTSFKG